jgi:autotransporter-associated beta strand protein
LVANNSYSGGTYITGGTVSGNTIANNGTDSAFGRSGFSISNGATLRYTGPAASTDRTFSLGAGDATIWVDNNSTIQTDLVVFGTVSGGGGLIKQGTGELVLHHTDNAYAGLNDLRQGSLQGRTLTNAGSTSSFGRGNFQLSGGAELYYYGATTTTDRTISLGTGGGQINVANTGTDLALTGTISGVGALVKQGLGSLTLTAATNSYAGTTSIGGGTLILGASGVIPDGSAVTVAADSAFFLNGFNETIGSLASTSSTSAVLLGSGTLTTGGNNASTTYSGTISGSGGLTKTGAGTMTLSGSNSYSGMTNIGGGGTLSGHTLANHGSNSAFGQGNIFIDQGSTLQYTGGSSNTDRVITLWGGPTNIDITNSATNLQLFGTISGSGGLTKNGSGILQLEASNVYGGNTVINNGDLRLGANERLPNNTAVTVNSNGTLNMFSATETIGSLAGSGSVINNGSLITGGNNTSTTFSGTISGTGGLTKTGSGTMTLSGSNSYSGTTTINSGVLSGNTIGNAGSSFGAGGPIQLNNGTLQYTGGTDSTNRTFIIFGGSIEVSNSATNLSLHGLVDGGGNLTKTGAGTLTMPVSSRHSNTVIHGGTLSGSTIANAGAFSSFGVGNIVISSGAALQYTGGNASTDRIISLGAGGGAIAVTNSGATLTSTGEISGSGGLTKMGAGKLTLTGGNSYSGSTLINGGTLVVNNTSGSATGTGHVTINPSGTLAGNGRVSGAVFVGPSGTLAPGNSIESLDVGALTFNTGGTFDYEINTDLSLTAAADLVNANGNLGIFAGAILAIADLGNTILADGTKFTLISYAGAWNGGTFDGYADDSLVTVGVNQYVLNYNDTSGGQNFGGGDYANNVTLTAANTAAVPEASSFIFGGIVCIALAGVHFGRKLLQK